MCEIGGARPRVAPWRSRTHGRPLGPHATGSGGRIRSRVGVDAQALAHRRCRRPRICCACKTTHI